MFTFTPAYDDTLCGTSTGIGVCSRFPFRVCESRRVAIVFVLVAASLRMMRDLYVYLTLAVISPAYGFPSPWNGGVLSSFGTHGLSRRGIFDRLDRPGHLEVDLKNCEQFLGSPILSKLASDVGPDVQECDETVLSVLFGPRRPFSSNFRSPWCPDSSVSPGATLTLVAPLCGPVAPCGPSDLTSLGLSVMPSSPTTTSLVDFRAGRPLMTLSWRGQGCLAYRGDAVAMLLRHLLRLFRDASLFIAPGLTLSCALLMADS